MPYDVQMNTDALTLEETNKVRVSLGLKPIGMVPMDGEDTPVDADLQAEENYTQRRAEMAAEKREGEVKEKIVRSKNRLAHNPKLSGPTLGSSKSDNDLNTKAWAKKLNKRTAQNDQMMTAKRARELEERDAAVYNEGKSAIPEMTLVASRADNIGELAGLKVNHAPDDFEAGEDIILTLKNTRVLATDEDELQNIALTEDEALRAAKERKRKAQEIYAGYDDEEFDEIRIGKKAEILAKYSDSFATRTIKPEGFRLGAPLKKEDVVEDNSVPIGMPSQSKVRLNLDYGKDYEVGDYVKGGEAGFRMPRNKKVKRSTRKAEVDEEGQGMDVDVARSGMGQRQMEAEPTNLVDDDDLQAALARSRRDAARNKPKVKTGDDVAQVASSTQHDHLDIETMTTVEDDRGLLTFDPTSEFARNIAISTLDRPSASAHMTATGESSSPTVDITSIDRISTALNHERALSAHSVSTNPMLSTGDFTGGAVDGREDSEISIDIMRGGGLVTEGVSSEAPLLSISVASSGMASYLAHLRQSGNMSQSSAEATRNEIEQRKADAWKAQHRALLLRHEQERASARHSKSDQAQREAEIRALAQRQARELAALLSEYRPHVTVRYHDESGRANQKLGSPFRIDFRSGRLKTEKRLQKHAVERKREQMLAIDTPSGMSQAFSRRQEKTGEAFMVLGVGNRGSVQAVGGVKKRD